MKLTKTVAKHWRRDRFLKGLFIFDIKKMPCFENKRQYGKGFKHINNPAFVFSNELELTPELKDEVVDYAVYITGSVKSSARVFIYYCAVGLCVTLGFFVFEKQEVSKLIIAACFFGAVLYLSKREIRLSRELIQKLARFSPQNALYLREKGLLED